MITVGIVGASGYSGEVLLELLSGHPVVGKFVVASRSNVGQPVEAVMPRLAGLLNGVCFVEADADKLAEAGADVWFLALPHGVAAQYAKELLATGARIIDLSADFRLVSSELYREYYGAEHPNPELLAITPYVLPELSSGWESAQLIACPGCYPSSILYPLIPMAREGMLPSRGIVINSMSGISGAGKKENLYYSFAERVDSALAYGVGRHRHLSEVEEQLGLAAGSDVRVQFTPHLIPVLRGIATTIVVPGGLSADAVYDVWQRTYSGRPGVRILPTGTTPETRPVLGRNRVDFSAYADKRTGNLVVTSAIDNLMKGASSQAIQIMNIALGMDEFTGLK